MSTVFNIRNLGLPRVSRAAVLVGSILVVLAIIAGVVGFNLYKQLTNNTVTAYFKETLALYPGDRVQIMGVPVGKIDKIEPYSGKECVPPDDPTRTTCMRVTLHYANK